MALLETLATKLTVDLIKWLGGQGISHFTKSPYDEYEKELHRIIDDTCAAYKLQYGGSTESGKTHFCDSQVVLSELLKFRLSKNPKAEELNRVIHSDPRVEVPTEREMSDFLEIFSEKIKQSTKLVELNIENNSKEEIFNVSAKVDAIAIAIDGLKKDGPAELIEEWIKRLGEVTSNIEKFKPKTALDILERLEARISEKGISISDTMKGRITYLKAACLSETHLGIVNNTISELFIKAFKYSPDNTEFKSNAGLAYLVLGDKGKAEQIANEILQKDEYHSGAWALKVLLADSEFMKALNEVPANVKVKREFKAQVSHWLVNKGFVPTIVELDKLGFHFDTTDIMDPPAILSRNKWYWTNVITYCINKLYEVNTLLSTSGFDPGIKENMLFKYTHSLLNKLSTAVEGSEVEEYYIWHKFQLLYMDYVISQDRHSVHLLEISFNKIKEKASLETLQMAQVYNSLGTSDYTRKAIKVIEEYGEHKDEILSLFNSYNRLQVNSPVESSNSFKAYLNTHKTIDERRFYNVIQYLEQLRKQSKDVLADVKSVVVSMDFNPPVLLDLFNVLTIYSNDLLNTDAALLEKIKNEVDSNSETLRFFVAMAYYLNGKHNDTAEYLKEKVNKEKASNELKLYCQVLYDGDGDKHELLSILESWRKNHPLDHSLTRMELHLREVQGKWDTLTEVARQGLTAFPGDESLLYAFFLGLDRSLDTVQIKENVYLVENRDFNHEPFGIALSGMLLRAGLQNEAIELLYRTASKKHNVQARSSYMASLINYRQEIFKDVASVEIGTYVQYELDEKIEVLFIDERCAQTNQGKALLNKTAGEVISVGNTKMTGKQITIRVIRIMNKYSALLSEIMKEIENPMSGHSIEVIKYDGSNAESILKSLIENLGVEGSLHQDRQNVELEKYYGGVSSFAEVAAMVFSRKRFEAYFHLTSSVGKRFLAISPSISVNTVFDSASKFVLDVTSVCLFFQLSKELGLVFKHKFIISASVRGELVDLITETKMNPEPKLTMNITTEGVARQIYQEGYKENRLVFLQEILQWMDSNCVVDLVDEKLNFVLSMELTDPATDKFMHENIENRLLADRPDHFLLTNDTFYYRFLNAGTGQAMSPEIYLERFHKDKIRECSAYMLKGNYVGISMYFEVLQEEFLNMISGKDSKFPICLENFGYAWNPNLEHATVIARFAKWIYLSNSILSERKNQTVHTLFLSSLRNAPLAFRLKLKDEIAREFFLLADSLLHVQLILLDALKVLGKS